MSIIVNLDVMMAKRKMSSNELAQKIGITTANLSILKTNKGKAIRFSTLDKICEVLDCTPGDILEYKKWCLFGDVCQKEENVHFTNVQEWTKISILYNMLKREM